MPPAWLSPLGGGLPTGFAFVAISRQGAGRHLGLIHRRREAGAARVIHLAFHHELMDEPSPSDSFENGLCVRPSISPELASNIAALCRRVAQRRERIPYALRYSGSSFVESGELSLLESDAGLTCATFVVALFRSVGVDLLDLGSWRTREDDRVFQEWVVRELRRRGENDHADRVESEVGCARFRPSEVAGSSSADAHPVAFEVAIRLGEEVEANLPA